MPARRPAAILALLLAASLLPGCLLVAGAAIGAGVVHATGEDEASVLLEADHREAFEAARSVLRERGILESADSDRGTLTGSIGSSSVEIRVAPRSEGGSKATVASRRNGGLSPDVETAQQTATGILARCR